MSQTSNNLLHDQSYACLNGLMFNGAPSVMGNPNVANPIMTGINNNSQVNTNNTQGTNNSQATTNNSQTQTNPTTPYTMNDYVNDINGKDKFEPTQTENTVEDGVDDGKISFKSKLKNFGKGLISPIANIIKHPLASALGLAVGVGAIVATGGAITPLLIAAGVGMGAVKIGSGIYKQATAKTDAQAENAWQSIGSGTTDIGLSVLGSKKALKTSGITPKGGFIKSTIQCFKEIPNAVKSSYTAIKDGVALANLKNIFSRFKKHDVKANSEETNISENKPTIEQKKGKTTTHKTESNGDKVDTRYYDNKIKTQKTTTPDGDSVEIKYTKGGRPNKITTKSQGHKTSNTRIRYDNQTYEELGRVTTNPKDGEIVDVKFADGKGGYSDLPNGYEIQDVNGQKALKDTRTYSEKIADKNLAKIKSGKTEKSVVGQMIDDAIKENPNGNLAKIRAAKIKLSNAIQKETTSTPKYTGEVQTQKANNIKLNGKNVSQGAYRRIS